MSEIYKLKRLWHNIRLPHLHTEENVSDSPMFAESGYLITKEQLEALYTAGMQMGVAFKLPMQAQQFLKLNYGVE